MKVYIDRSSTWARQTVRIYAVDSGPGARRLWQSHGGDKWSFEDIREGQTNDAEPTFEMPLDMLEAIVAAAHDILPPSAATDRHLKDAVAVRDRLLTLLEGGK
jgi:hypothetical protein